ncbi:hypothetical protein ACAG26_12530 [Mycobacterium sp. pUA109]|uniref:hypothetical protein n=1 Tax=Mycobacterium sp. pUA109 TaxID=3238982 RepID=UPI00351B3292
MTAIDQRQELHRLAEEHGWQRNERDRVDIYIRGRDQVHVVWRGTEAISGGSRYEDYILGTYSRDLATVQGWLKR